MDDKLKRARHSQILSLLMDLHLDSRVRLTLTERNPANIPCDDPARAFEIMALNETLDTDQSFLAVYAPFALDVHLRPFLFAVSTSSIDEIVTKRAKNGSLKSFTVHFAKDGKLSVTIPDSVQLEMPGEKRKTHFFH